MVEYDKDAIVYPYITSYIRGEIPERCGILKELEEYAQENSVPIVQPETAKLLEVLMCIKRPMRILEVGCAIGYSAILMAQYLEEGGSITTLEWDAATAEIARKNIEKAGLSDTITVICNDAKEVIPNLTGEYDVIFLDGPKAHYIYMLNDCIRLLKKGGILVSDNILYKGMIADDEHVIRRKITIVKRLRRFISAQMQRGELETVILPLGDGVTVAVKK
ncbi:MAG: O-methyltransferase [Clostridia bacterium]|nr:O-methyltransferase [Clostridia bacterium]